MPRPLSILLSAIVVGLIGMGVWWLAFHEPDPPTATPNDAATAAAAKAEPGRGEGAAVQGGEAATPGANAMRADASLQDTTPQPGATATLTVLARWPDDLPAAGVHIYVRCTVRFLPYVVVDHGVTDADGRVTFADLTIAQATLQSDRDDQQKVDLIGGDQEVVFVLAAGVDIEGVVVDPEGHPAPHAEIWLQTHRTDWSGGRVVTTADDRGRFTLRRAPTGVSLGAIGKGHGPSKLIDLDLVDTSDPPVSLRLELVGEGGSLVGRVVDSAGAPIENALVAAGSNPTHLDMRGNDQYVEHWTCRTAHTDADGRFSMDGLATGALPVAIRAEGFGIWREEVAIEHDATAEIAATLGDASAIEGFVTGAQNEPMVGARVRIYDVAPRTPFIAGGQIDFDETLGYVGTLTDEAGWFRVDGVTPGTAHAFAQEAYGGRDGSSVAFVAAELTVAPGATLEWNPVITDGRCVDGVVLYRDGHPMPHVFVTLTNEQTGAQSVMTNDRDGEFRFKCLDGGTYGIQVQYWSPPKGTPRLERAGIAPDSGRVELRAPFDKPVKLEDGHVTGRIDDLAGRITNPKAASVTLQSEKNWFRPDGPIVDGAFEFRDVTPGRFRIILVEGDNAIAHSGWHDLAPAATLDVGVLSTQPAGGLRLLVDRGPDTDACEPRLYLTRDGDSRGTKVELGRKSEVAVPNLTPGSYRISGYFTGMVPVSATATITAGNTSELRLALTAGASCRCEVWLPPGHGATAYHYRFLDADGAVVHEYGRDLGSMPTRPLPFSRTLPLGTYTVEFSTDNDLRAEAPFTIESLDQEISLKLELQ